MADESRAAKDPRDLTDDEIDQAADRMTDDEWNHPDNPLLVESFRRAHLLVGLPLETADESAQATAADVIAAHQQHRGEEELQRLINEVLMETPIEDMADVLRPLAVPHEEPRDPHLPLE